ncbi:F-box/LRR-repeat protein, partial [Trifolium pratense]
MSTRSRKTRKKKSGTEIENVVEEDMFYSKLSEPHLISHILSFLPTRDAVRTSVLSKKWLDNWTFITKLDFDDGLYHDSYGLRICTHCKSRGHHDFYVSNKVGSDDLTLCGSCSNSEDALYNGGNSLSFSDLTKVKAIGVTYKQSFVKFVYHALLFTKNNNSSISSMLERRVKNLKIHSSVHNLPFSASTSKSLLNSTQLEELELVLSIFTTINVPSNSVHFGHLKHLKLSGIDFTIDHSCDYLTLRLPVLKKFEISNCEWSSRKDVFVDASLLENISIQQDLSELQGKSIKFNALYLKEFNYCGYGISQQINLSGCSFMPYASVKIILKQCENNISETRCFYFQLFQHFHQMKCIKLEGLEFLTQTKEDVYPVSALPVFANLSHMELGVVTIEVIFSLLQNSPVLKTLVLALK